MAIRNDDSILTLIVGLYFPDTESDQVVFAVGQELISAGFEYLGHTLFRKECVRKVPNNFGLDFVRKPAVRDIYGLPDSLLGLITSSLWEVTKRIRNPYIHGAIIAMST